MNKIFRYLTVAAAALFLGACTPDSVDVNDYEAPDIVAEDMVPGVAYSVTQDADNPNIVYLKSLLPVNYTPMWIHPQGQSQEHEVTLQIPFAGSYEVTFGVMTRGGMIYAEPYPFELSTMCTDFISDPLWATISGGVGESKTWVLDIDADGKTTYFKGPIWFFRNGYTWDALHLPDGTSYLEIIDQKRDFNEEWKNTIAPFDEEGKMAWYWAADYAGNSWMCAAGDYGEMTFDLIDGANVTITDAGGNVTRGTYMLDLDTHQLTLSNVVMLSPTGITANPTPINILVLDENRMQLTAEFSDETSLRVYNYVTKEYFENPPQDEPVEQPTEPTLPDGWENVVSQITQTSIKWTLSDTTPFDWASLSGARLNEFSSLADYSSAGWVPVPDPSTYSDFSLTLDSSDNSAVYVGPDGTQLTGSYTLDASGIYTFDIDFSFQIAELSGWAINFEADSDNQLRILSIGTDAAGRISSMWVGAKQFNESGDLHQYMAYCLVANVGQGDGGQPSVPEGVMIPVDNSKVYSGDLEGNGNFRIELYNEYGGHGLESVVQPSDISFSEYMTINVTLSNVQFNANAEDSYTGGVFYVAQGWSATVDTRNDTDGVMITGDGTYSFRVANAGGAEGATVFCIDILGMSNGLVDPDAVNVTINSVVMDGEGDGSNSGQEFPFDSSKAIFGDLEGNGNFRIEIYNMYGAGTNNDPGLTPDDLVFAQKLRVTYTLAGTGVSGSYSSCIIFADGSWSVQFWGEGKGGNANIASTTSATVTGDGTYTVELVPTITSSGVAVFCVDVTGLGAAIVDAGGDPAAITCTVDKIEAL